jgi:hypothetical protein
LFVTKGSISATAIYGTPKDAYPTGFGVSQTLLGGWNWTNFPDGIIELTESY